MTFARLQPLLLLLFAGIISPGAAQETAPAAPPILTNVAQVRQLTSKEAARALPVKLKGVMLAESDPRTLAIMIADETGGLYLRANTGLFGQFRRGDLLEVSGVSDPGEFAPMVRVSQARKIGTSTNPAPRSVSYHQLLTGALDAQWVELTGVVRRYIPPETNSTIWRILVAADGGVVSVRGTMPHDPKLKEDAEVCVQAICLYQFNKKRQVLTPILQLPSNQSVVLWADDNDHWSWRLAARVMGCFRRVRVPPDVKVADKADSVTLAASPHRPADQKDDYRAW
ncbi:MAG: hypothetical protein QM813_18755 [Verrucomicrobiota bacterium]